LDEAVISPFLKSLIKSLNDEKAPSVAPVKQELNRFTLTQKFPIKNFYHKVISFLQTNFLQTLLQITTRKQENEFYVEGYNVILALWKSTFNVLMSPDLSFIFSIGIVDNFNANYKAAIAFLNNLANFLSPNVSL